MMGARVLLAALALVVFTTAADGDPFSPPKLEVPVNRVSAKWGGLADAGGGGDDDVDGGGSSSSTPHPLPPPPPLPGLWWFAPILSGGGYCTEANALLYGLHTLPSSSSASTSTSEPTPDVYSSNRKPLLRATHHGDMVDVAYYRGLPKEYYDMLNKLMMARYPPARSSVVVCHSEPGAWSPARYETSRCPPEGYTRDDAMRVVGRTMFETDRLEAEHVRRCNKMDEVWVPTAWSAGVFAKSGVEPGKIRVVPEAVDVDFFDPEAVTGRQGRQGRGGKLPLDIVAVGRRVLGPPIVNEYNDDNDGGIGDGEDGEGGRSGGVGGGDGGGGGVTKLLSIFKWEARKAPEVLLDAYLSEFTADDDVALFVRCNLYHEEKDLVGERVAQIARDKFTAAAAAAAADANAASAADDVSRLPWGAPRGMDVEEALNTLAPRVFVLPQVPDADMPSLYAAADALVLPSRGEGWGRPHVEAMSMALPVIATNWSGPTEFMTAENSYPLAVEPKLVKLPPDHVFKKHYWAQPSVRHLRGLMRRVVADPEEAAAKGAAARRTMVERFSPRAVARLVVDELERIAREVDAADKQKAAEKKAAEAKKKKNEKKKKKKTKVASDQRKGDEAAKDEL